MTTSNRLHHSLFNFQMYLLVKLPNGDKFHVRQVLRTPWDMCNNRWHQVEARIRPSAVRPSIWLKVDDLEPASADSDHSTTMRPVPPAPIYIGGVSG